MTGHRFDFDGLARERARHENRLRLGIDDAIAAMTDPIDDETLNHARPR